MLFGFVTDERKHRWNNPASAGSPVELEHPATETPRSRDVQIRCDPEWTWAALPRLSSLRAESHPACTAPTFSGRKNDSFPTQLLLSLHRLLWNVSPRTLPSAGPSFSSIELQTLVDANEVEEPLCWELWKWRDTNENRWFLRSTSTHSMSQRGFGVVCKVLIHFCGGTCRCLWTLQLFHRSCTFSI